MHIATFEKPLVIKPSSSNSLKVIIYIPHILTFIFIVFLVLKQNMNIMVGIVLTLLVILSFIYYYRWHISKKLKKSVLSIEHRFHKDKKNGWFIMLLSQAEFPVELLSSSFVSTRWIQLNFKNDEGKYYTLILPSDAVTAEEHRQLRVRMHILA